MRRRGGSKRQGALPPPLQVHMGHTCLAGVSVCVTNFRFLTVCCMYSTGASCRDTRCVAGSNRPTRYLMVVGWGTWWVGQQYVVGGSERGRHARERERESEREREKTSNRGKGRPGEQRDRERKPSVRAQGSQHSPEEPTDRATLGFGTDWLADCRRGIRHARTLRGEGSGAFCAF